jgi:16S rRNA (guanine966-N2)-methyltransferase
LTITDDCASVFNALRRFKSHFKGNIMRVITGTSRGKRLTAFKGSDVRPTPDRVREALFSILQSKLGAFTDLRVLDLFAGSGALAIEALSRGAASACLVEKSPAAEKIILENLELCRLTVRATLICKDAWQVLQNFAAKSFDLIFLDPPYRQGLAERALIETDRLELLSDHGVLCVETGADEILPDTIGRLHRVDQRRYGTTLISLYSYLPKKV